MFSSRPWALLLLLTFGLMTVTTVQTQDRAYAAPVVALIGSRVVTGLGLATVTGEVMAAGSGTVQPYQRPSSPAYGSRVRSVAAKGGRLGGYASLAANLAEIAGFQLPWSLNEGTDPAYADPAPAGVGWSPDAVFPLNATNGMTTGTASDVAVSTANGGQHEFRITPDDGSPQYGVKIDVYCADATPRTLLWGTSGGFDAIHLHQPLTGSCVAVEIELRGHDPATGTYSADPGATWTPATTVAVEPGTTQMTTTTRTTCSDGSVFEATITYTALTDPKPDIVLPSCPAGTLRDKVEQATVTSDGRAVTSPMGTWTRPAVPAGYPSCPPPGCLLQLWQVTPTPPAEVLCNDTTLCADWKTQTATSPAVKTLTVTKPDGSTATEVARAWPDGRWLECRYGPYLVPTSECEVVPTEPAPEPDGQLSNCDLGQVSFNPVSWVVVPLKCLWVPSPATMTRWSSRVDTIKTRPPVSVAVGGIDAVREGAAEVSCTSESPDGSCAGWAIPAFTTMDGAHSVDVVQAAGDRVQGLWGGRIYALLQAGIVVGAALWIWQRIAASFGDKG